MGLVNKTSLAGTIDALNEAFFLGRALSRAQRQEAAEWIASRQGLPGSYAGMFAPTQKDQAKTFRVFTGEGGLGRAGMRHVLGEEACRALILLDVPDRKVRDALSRGSAGMIERMADRRNRASGTYCCGRCSAALWRHLAVGGLTGAEQLLAAGLKTLKAHRDPAKPGRWRRFGFWYTLLALSEIDRPSARAELRYAAPACERALRRSATGDTYPQRRKELARRILALL